MTLSIAYAGRDRVSRVSDPHLLRENLVALAFLVLSPLAFFVLTVAVSAWLAVPALIALSTLGTVLVTWVSATRREFAERQGQPLTVTVDADGVELASPLGRSRYGWAAVRESRWRRGHVELRLADAGRVVVERVPRAAVPDEAALRRALEVGSGRGG